MGRLRFIDIQSRPTLSGASDAMATHGLIGMNSFIQKALAQMKTSGARPNESFDPTAR
jgi:hypothetical protein